MVTVFLDSEIVVDMLYSYARNFTRQIPSDYADNVMPEYGDMSSNYEDDDKFMVECYSIDSGAGKKEDG